jgi:hypothetical protein
MRILWEYCQYSGALKMESVSLLLKVGVLWKLAEFEWFRMVPCCHFCSAGEPCVVRTWDEWSSVFFLVSLMRVSTTALSPGRWGVWCWLLSPFLSTSLLLPVTVLLVAVLLFYSDKGSIVVKWLRLKAWKCLKVALEMQQNANNAFL